MNDEPSIVIKAGRERSLRRRHPWIFSGAIERVEGEPAPGATVAIVDGKGGFLARAAFSPQSQIRARVWTFDAAEQIDASFFMQRVARAIETRRRLGRLGADDACRLVFSEADWLPGLIVDRYAGYLVCQFLSAGAEAWREPIIAALLEQLQPRGLYERSEGTARRKEGLQSTRGLLVGEEAEAIAYRSGGLERRMRLGGGQKTGAYLDQLENTARVARYAEGARVLDAFAYTGGFGMAALRAGGTEATFVDSSGEALEAAAEEARLNGLDAQCRFVARDVFDTLRGLHGQGERFGLVVLDPPKFVHSASQIPSGSRGYKEINLSALKLVAPGGTLATFSCSGHVDAALFQKIVAGAALDAHRDVQILERLSQPPDHPISIEFPEADYLTGLVLKVH